jgi:hypothetical protein
VDSLVYFEGVIRGKESNGGVNVRIVEYLRRDLVQGSR